MRWQVRVVLEFETDTEVADAKTIERLTLEDFAAMQKETGLVAEKLAATCTVVERER